MSHRLAKLPMSAVLRMPDAPNRVLICMISRGVAPVLVVGDMMAIAERYHAGAAIVAGLPAVTAKNAAADVAQEFGASLLLIEDDILADAETWSRALAPTTEQLPIRLATAMCRNGTPNTRFADDGTVLSSGTPFVLVPHWVLLSLPTPRFAAYDFGLVNGELLPRRPNEQGMSSDTWFWHQVRQLEPRPAVDIVGHVTHLMHPLNRERHDLVNPCEVTVA